MVAYDASPATDTRGDSSSLPGWALPAGLALLGLSLVGYLAAVRLDPAVMWGGLDLRVYHEAGAAYLAGKPVYDMGFTSLHLPYTYPPITLLAFGALSVLPVFVAKALITVATVGALVGAVWLTLGMLGHQRDRGRLALACVIAAVLIWLEPIQRNLIYGQVNSLLMLLVLFDFALPTRHRLKGIGIGIAAAAKLVPAIFILYCLVTHRFRQALVGLATFVVLGLAGFAIAPEASVKYWFDGLFLSSGRVANVVGPEYVGDQSLHGLSTRLWSGTTTGEAVWLSLAAITAVAGLALAAQAYRRAGEIYGVVVCALVALLVSPISWTHHWVWLAPVTALLVHAALRSTGTVSKVAVAIGVLLTAFWLVWPVREDGHILPLGLLWTLPNNAHAEYHWTVPQRLLGESYSVAAVLLIVAIWWWLRRGEFRRQ